MSPDDATAAAEMWEAATTVGFFTLINHGIPQETIEKAFSASAGFFARDRDEKYARVALCRAPQRSYEFMSQVRPSRRSTADQKESLQITAREGVMDGRWPSEPSSSLSLSLALSLSLSLSLSRVPLSLTCVCVCVCVCPKLPRGTLSGSHRLWSDDGQCTLRMLHYPPTAPPEPPPTDGSEPPKQVWRAAPHTDWACLTLLYQLPGNEGLECAANPRVGQAHTGWLTVDPIEGGIAVNIGDMLSRWSAGRLLSNLHRVRMPTEAECKPPKSRYSIGFFMQADKRRLIESETHETISAGDSHCRPHTLQL